MVAARVSTQLGCSILATLTAVATPMLLTTTPLNVGAGAVYGVFLGSLVSLVGATAGAVLCFAAVAGLAGARVGAAENQRQPAVDVAGPRRARDARRRGDRDALQTVPDVPVRGVLLRLRRLPSLAADFLAGTLAGLAPGTAMTSYIGWNLYDVTKLKSEASEVDSMKRRIEGRIAARRLRDAQTVLRVGVDGDELGRPRRARAPHHQETRARTGGGRRTRDRRRSEPRRGAGGVGALGGLRSLQETNKKKKRGVLLG